MFELFRKILSLSSASHRGDLVVLPSLPFLKYFLFTLKYFSLYFEILCFRLADAEILRKPDYFGKFGKIHKVVINHSTQYAGSQLQVSCLSTSFSASINNVSSESCTGAKCQRVCHLLQV